MNRFAVCVAAVLALAAGARAQSKLPEPRYGVDMPTAGVLHPRQYALDVAMARGGSVNLVIGAGVFPGLMIGVGFGGTGIIGTGDIQWQNLPSAMIKYRLIDETLLLPAIALGFDSQGNEGYRADAARFTIKSPGLYVAASKYFAFLGTLGLHGSLNYSLERASADSVGDGRGPNLAVSAEKSLGSSAAVTLEYNAGFNDHNVASFGRDRGYLNAGFRWYPGVGLLLELDVNDLLGNENGAAGGARVVRIGYTIGD